MISVVVVYNDERVLSEWLLDSLKNQSATYELIFVDNRANIFTSAAAALNWGGSKARGDYLMFVHQDVKLLSNTWLEEAENILRSLPRLGAAGVAGKRGDVRGVLSNAIHGIPPRPAGDVRISRPVRVQTLDPVLIIVPRSVFERVKFDEEIITGWHLYAEDYCLTLQSMGLNCYVLPPPVYHKSTGVKPKKWRLLDYGPYPDEYYIVLKKMLRKHRHRYRRIYTTCGDYYTFIPLFIQLVPSRIARKLMYGIARRSLYLFIETNIFKRYIIAYFKAKYRELIARNPGLDDFINFAFEFNALQPILLAMSKRLINIKDMKLVNTATIRPAQVREEIRELLRILEELKPKTILEIGTERGGTLFLLSQVASEDATIISIDLPWMEERYMYGFGYPPWREELYKSFARGGQRIVLLRRDSHDPETLREVERILAGRKLDFLFIDGDHSYEGVRRDFEMYSLLVRKGGIIAFHGIVSGPPENVSGVPRFWSEVKKNYKHLEIVKDRKQGRYGIGVLFA